MNPGGPGDLARLGQADVVGDLGDAEVDEDRPLGAEHDVGGLEVAVDDAGVVDGGEGVDQPVGQVRQVAGVGGQVVGALVVDLVLQGGPVNELGDDKSHAAAVGAVARLDVEDAGHAGVLDARQDTGLAIETTAGHGVGGDLRVQDLHGHVVALGVGHLPHHAHAAGAETAQQPIPADIRSRPQAGQRGRRRGPSIRVLRHGATVPAGRGRPRHVAGFTPG